MGHSNLIGLHFYRLQTYYISNFWKKIIIYNTMIFIFLNAQSKVLFSFTKVFLRVHKIDRKSLPGSLNMFWGVSGSVRFDWLEVLRRTKLLMTWLMPQLFRCRIWRGESCWWRRRWGRRCTRRREHSGEVCASVNWRMNVRRPGQD